MNGDAKGSGTAARHVITYAAVVLGGLALAPWAVRAGWVGNLDIHSLHETVAVVLALGVAAIALIRFYSRKSDTFLLLGAAFVGTAFLDGYHALATSTFFAEHFQASELASTSPWSWLASRAFLGCFLWVNAPRNGPPQPETRLDDRVIYLLVGAVTLAFFTFFSFIPLPSAYLPNSVVHRPADFIPALFFLLAGWRYLRRGRWREAGFDHWMLMALLLGLVGQIAFMPFASRPFDAPSEAGHLAKNLSYLCVLAGLLGNMYSLFRRADESTVELARITERLQAEIDERNRAERERDQFFDMSLEMLCIAGADGYFKQLNQAWELTLGWTVEELMARPFTEFVHPDDRVATTGQRQRLSQGGLTVDFENRYLAKDGTYRWLSWSSAPAPEQGLIYAVARDVEERKRIERMKNDFVSMVSHELRTPLTSIRGSLGLIAGGVAGELPPKAHSLVEIAAKNCERLVRLINDILDIEKIESGRMSFRFSAVELRPLVEQAVESNRAFAGGYEVELRVAGMAGEAQVLADPDRLLQVITNLISNAVKFSPHSGVVEVTVERAAGGLRVSVTDHGSGIPPEFRSRIFERFAQADSSSTRAKEGTGLGLSISRAIVERHHGQIGFTSEPGVATAFYFDLPEWAATIAEATPEAGERPLILICEDDWDVARLLRLMLERDGYRADVAHDAAEARRLLCEHSYAAMTLDLVLPDQDGLTLIRELRRNEATVRLPIVVVSVRAEEGQIALNGGAVGVIDWLVKPIDENRLKAAMKRAVHALPGESPSILHVEDDHDLQRVVAAIVGGDAVVEQAFNLAAARECLERKHFDLVILDLALPDGSGLELLPFLGGLEPSTPVLIFSGHDVDALVADRVASVLIKSQTSNRELLERVRAALGSPSEAPVAVGV
ncbi:MAG TPA: response regulator [Thermoanaerobaculia bacterium]|jgi:PAS domain S-box-containing protein|nr:response regulator [Thermoanaerobaculia bacterium]